MDSPDKRLFQADVDSARFQSGVASGRWGFPDNRIPAAPPPWPRVILWFAAARRENSPDRFYLRLDLAGYRNAAPTGTFCDPATGSPLDRAMRPKGRPGSRFERVFRTDWEGGRAFYHPYDRVALPGHENWATENPQLVWTAECTIVDYLLEFRKLLNSKDYIGV